MSSQTVSVRPPPARQTIALPRVGAQTLLTLLFGAALSAVAFGAQGGLQIGRTTVVEMAATLAGAGLAAAALVVAPLRSRFWGGATLASLIALAVWTALSVSWSVQPADSWTEANRTISYVAVFAGGLGLARIAPAQWPALLGGVVLACFVVCGYGLLTKVFPGAFSPTEFYARLREPYDYWNAIGLMGALGVPACLWLGTRREGHGAVNALAFPVLGLLIVTLMISYSRGSLAAIVVGLAAWFALVPLRLRGVLVLAVSAVPAGLVTAWAFRREALIRDNVIVPVRADAGHELGVLLVLMLIVLLFGGLAASYAQARRPLTGEARLKAGRWVGVLVALLPVAGIVALTLSDRGLGGSISKTWSTFTDPDADPPSNDPGRLTAAGSVRARYWRDGLKIYQSQQAIGNGAGAYATARFRVRKDTASVRHAHGYWAQTLADLGVVGLLISLTAVAAWLGATARAIGLGTGRSDGSRAPPGDAERVGLVTLAVTALVFGIHSLVDWSWFIPGTAMLGILCAAWVAGRGPAFQAMLPAATGRERALRITSGAAVGVVALVIVWAMWQPLRSISAGDEALDLVESGRFSDAREKAKEAADLNPLAIEPLFELSAVEEASGRGRQARKALDDAVRLQPANPASWTRLSVFELRAGKPDRALTAARAALYLDPLSPQTRRILLRAVRVTQQPGTPATTAPTGTPAPAGVPPAGTPGAKPGPSPPNPAPGGTPTPEAEPAPKSKP